jgi:hypothetical protein
VWQKDGENMRREQLLDSQFTTQNNNDDDDNKRSSYSWR